jgi:uncharacterized protein (TIGR02271 family)
MPSTTRKKTTSTPKDQEASPVGIGIGATGGVAAGAATGAAIGTAIGGPIGTAIGGVIGAIAGGVGGGYAGNEIAHAIDPVAEDTYWKSNYSSRPYVAKEAAYTQYRPAYRYGVTAATKIEGKTFEDVEADLRKDWGHSRGKSKLAWEDAKPAVRDAYDRVLTLHEERLHAHKDTVQTGAVKVRKEVITEQQTIQVPVEREEIIIERRAVNGRSSGASLKAEEIRIPVKEEKVHVTKDVVVKEEVDVKKRKVRGTETVTDNVRYEEVKVDSDGKTNVRTKK